MDLDAVSADLAIRRLHADYCAFVDAGDFDALGELFAESATLVFRGEEFAGRDEVVAQLREMQPPERRGLHTVTDARITIDGERAGGSCTFQFYRPTDGWHLAFLGYYHDNYVRETAGWRYATRRIELL